MDRDRILAKIRKCLALAADARGDATMRDTASRQAARLMEQLEAAEAAGVPKVGDAGWAPYWRQRTSADAQRAGVRAAVLCSNGWYVPQ